MKSNALNWHSITPPTDRKYLVKGTELAVAIVPHTLSRFQLCEIRTFDGKYTGVRYVVRDAATVTDAEVKQGVRSRIVAAFDGIDDAVKWCHAQ